MKTKILIALALTVMLSGMLMATASAALPTNMSWVKAATNPVVASNKCFSGDHVRPAILRESNNNYKMYVSQRGLTGPVDLYLLTTSDGGSTWACGNSGSPVLTRGAPGAWDDTRVEFATVLEESPGDYKMWYSGRNSTAAWGIGYATSSDGMSWTKYAGNPVLTGGTGGAWDSLRAMEPTVINVGGTYHMWYTGEKVFPYSSIGHATASNPEGPWTKDAGNPVFTGSAGTWDANEVYAPTVIPNGGAYEMFYSGNNGGTWMTGHASAANANGPWTKDPNAILSLARTGWEASADSLDYAGAVLDGGTWKVFYSAGGTYQIGLATLTNQPQLIFNQLESTVKEGDTVVVKIDLNAATNVYGYQFQVNFDQTKVSAVGAFVNTFFDTTTNANVPTGWNHLCGSGFCKFAASKLSPGTPVSGSGTIAEITFTGIGLTPSEPPASLTFSGDVIADKDGTSLTHSVTTGYINVTGSATISGHVSLQGRATPIDAGTVTLYDENGYVPPTTVNFSASDGSWTTTVPVSAGGTTFDAVAAHSLYLGNQKTGIVATDGGTFDQGTTKLLGGDADGSGLIDVSDLAIIGGQFGNSGAGITDARANINADNDVNILDLVLAGGNYGLNTPRPW